MKDALRTRLEFLWAKLAGRDVDINTLIPDVPTNMVEKLMLETADRISSAEGPANSLLVHIRFNEAGTRVIMDKTWKEISDAFMAGSVHAVFDAPDDPNMISSGVIVGAMKAVFVDGGDYEYLTFLLSPSSDSYIVNFTADTEDDYPYANAGEIIQ